MGVNSSKEARREYEKKWRAENKDKTSRYIKNWVVNNKESIRQYELNHRKERQLATKGYYERNREKFARYAKLRNLVKKYDVISLSYLEALKADPCAYCGKPSYHIDHIDPVSKGGPNDWTNLTGACGDCNIKKRAQPLLTFLSNRKETI